MFVRDDVTCDSLASSLTIPPSSALCARTQRHWYCRWSRSRRVEDAHVQLFGHFVAALQLRYSRQSRTPLGIPTCISWPDESTKSALSCLSRSERLLFTHRWHVRILYSRIIVTFSITLFKERLFKKIMNLLHPQETWRIFNLKAIKYIL